MAGTTTIIATSCAADGTPIVSYTQEVFAPGTLSIPTGARNLKTSLQDGKLVATYDVNGTGSIDSGTVTFVPLPTAFDTYSIDGAVATSPIETHPRFRHGGIVPIEDAEWHKFQLWQRDKNDTTLAGWKPDSTSTTEFQAFYFAYYLKGITEYYSPRVVLRYTTTSAYPANLSRLGKIDTPGFAPALPDDANWILSGASSRQEGTGDHSVTYEYMSSDRGGWDDFLYA